MDNIFIKPIILICCLVFSLAASFGQTEGESRDKYSILTEPFNKRPITVHRGQLQFNAGYSFSVRTKSYDPLGSKITLVEDGSASVIHGYKFNLHYGILEFIEAGAEMNWSRQGVRGKTLNYFSGADFITVNELTENKGFEDLRLWTIIRLPFTVPNFDFGVEGAISLPTAAHEASQPTHTVDYLGGLSYLINYNYNNKNGTGVPVWNAGAYLQYTLDKFTLVASGFYYSPMKEGGSIRWNETLQGTNFTYEKVPYSYLPSDMIFLTASLHYQATGWLDLYMGGSRSARSGGWTESAGLKYAKGESSIVYLQPGLEIQVSPMVRLTEVAGFTIAGENIDAPFFILTSLSFNFMPFTR